MTAPNTFYGRHLSHDQCWDAYQAMLEFDMEYDHAEKGVSEVEILAQKDTYYAHLLAEQNQASHLLPYKDISLDALTNREKGYDAMEAEKRQQDHRFFLEGNLPTTEEVDGILQLHHIEPEPLPYWETCVNRITSLLSDR